MRSLLLKLLNLLFPSEKPSESDRLNYYADQRCKTCPYRLHCMQEESGPDYTPTPDELEAIRVETLFRESARVVHQEYVSHVNTQPLRTARLTRMLDQQEYARRMQAEQEMRRHGSIE